MGKKRKPRKPRGMFWGGVLWEADILLGSADLRSENLRKLKQLLAWLTKAVAWAEAKDGEGV